MKKDRVRLDELVVRRGLAPSRQQAIGIILSGNVFIDGTLSDKAGRLVSEDAELSIKSPMPYVSRGGIKLEEALRSFDISVKDKIAMDIGASTGGFTDCLLQNGIRKVYCIDVGYGQLHWKLRGDSRVVNIERMHILKLDWTLITEAVEIVTADLSFISLTKILPSVIGHLLPSTPMIALVKPQFEVGKGEVGRGGIVRSQDKIQQAIDKVSQFAEGIGFRIKGLIPSPIPGQKGNREYLLYLES